MSKSREEAAKWLSTLSRGLRPEEGRSLREWLKTPANRTAILDSARIYHDPDVIAVLSELFPKSPLLQKQKVERSSLAIALMAAAAAALAALSPFALDGHTPWSYFRGSHLPTLPLEKGVYTTRAGERRKVRLADGSIVTLNAATHLGVVLSPGGRDVFVPSGEASFRVAHERGRAFVVHVGHRMFEAVGTDFNVKVLTPEKIEVTVAEGSVKVHYSYFHLPDTPANNRLREDMTFDDTSVEALETALVEPGVQFVRKLEKDELNERLAWQHDLSAPRTP